MQCYVLIEQTLNDTCIARNLLIFTVRIINFLIHDKIFTPETEAAVV